MAYMLVMNYSILLLIIVVIVNITMIHSGVFMDCSWWRIRDGDSYAIIYLVFAS